MLIKPASGFKLHEVSPASRQLDFAIQNREFLLSHYPANEKRYYVNSALVLPIVAFGLTIPAMTNADDVHNRPSVLFIAIDDLNDWVGFLGGHPQALTPHMDRLARRGIVFTNAHCASPACNPSRAAVFSGKMPWKTNVWSNKSRKFFSQHPDSRVLPHSFRDAGYVTYGTGKMMHSGAADNKRLFAHRFDVEQRWSPLTRELVRYTQEELPTKGTNNPRHVVRYRGSEIMLPLNRLPSDRKPESTEGESFDWGAFDTPDSEMGDTQITDWAIKRLKSHSATEHQKPFFLGVGYYRPHIPLFAPSKYFNRFKAAPAKLPRVDPEDLEDLSDTAREWAIEAVTAGRHDTVVAHEQWQAAVESYLACTTFVDAQIGRLIDALDASDSSDNTIIVLWSDHGWHLGEKQHWGKWTGWERSTRVPLVIVPPREAKHQIASAGKRCTVPVSLIDLYPTLVELCNLAPPNSLDGESLVPLIRNPQSSSDRIVVTSFDPGNVSLRSAGWRYLRYANESEELYDLKEDPNEWVNLAGQPEHATRVRSFRDQVPKQALVE